MNYRVTFLYGFDGTSWSEVDISDGIKSLRYHGDCNTSQDVRFGVCLSESVEIEWFNDAVVPQKGMHLKVEIQNSLDDVWTNYGKFKIDRVEKHEITSTAYAYDSTFDLDVDFSARLKELNDNGAFPMSITDLVLEALDTAGLVRTISIPSPEFAAPVIKAFYSNNITCKDIVLAFSAMTCTIAASSFNARETQSDAWLNGGDGISFEPYYDMSNSYNIVVSGDYTLGTIVRCKENGVYASEESAPPPNELKIINSEGATLGAKINHPAYQSANVYQITGNILVDNAISTGDSYSWNDIANAAYANIVADDVDLAKPYQWIPCSLRLDMFPFEFPFKAGDYARFIDASGTRRRAMMMHVTIDESSATISCGGNKSYETSQDQYKTLGEQNTTNMVNIEEIRKIRDVIGPYEPYLKAEDSHAVGDYFVWQSQLVKCTAAITAGDAIAIGTNVSATDVVSELGGSSITVDDELSSTSTNPVQNLVINAAIDALNDKDIIGSALTEEIPSNSDLNNYFRPGVWRVLSGAVANTIVNYPSVKLGGKILTILLSDPPSVGGYMLQMALLNGGRMFARYKAASTSTPTVWKEITMQGEITADSISAVSYTSQSLTSAQENQVLSNLGLTSDLKAATSVSVSNFFSTNPLSGATYDIRKSGKVVSFYAYFSSAPSAGTIKSGYCPCGGTSGHYMILPLLSKSSPYTPVGSVWINGNGSVTFYGASNGGYVSGTWVCT